MQTADPSNFFRTETELALEDVRRKFLNEGSQRHLKICDLKGPEEKVRSDQGSRRTYRSSWETFGYSRPEQLRVVRRKHCCCTED